MKKAATLLIVLLSFFSDAQPITRKVLFLGNSYTYVNNLPQIISDFATSLSDTLVFDLNAPGGYTLDQHYEDSTSVQKIEAGGWDYVVMQEQSQLPSFEDYYSYGATQLCRKIKEYNPCSRKIFYMTWGRKNGDAYTCTFWPPVCTYEGMDSLLHLRYMEMAASNNADVSPVGAVWKYIRQNYPGIELYQADESHPSPAGSYAAACCFYAALFGKDPTLSSYDYLLSANDAANIRNAAKIIVYDSLQNWRLSNYDPHADFNYTIGHGLNEVVTLNQSTNVDNYRWDFGDGDTSVLKSPTHNYLADGNYVITLITENCDLNDIYRDTIQKSISFCSHSPTIFPDSLVVCPNSSDTIWTQSFDSYQWYDDFGNAIPGETNQYILASGGYTYSVLTESNNCSEMSPQVFVSGFIGGLIFYFVDYYTTSTRPDTICNGDTVFLILRTNKPDGIQSHYQWYRNNLAIPSAIDDTLIVTSDGDYNVEVVNDYCPNYIVFQHSPIPLDFINCNIGIDENNSENFMTIFPNPAENTFTVSVRPDLINSNYSLVDISGRELISGTLNKINNIDVTGISEGVYFFVVDGKYCQRVLKLIRD